MNYTAETLGLLKVLMETPYGFLILISTLLIGLMLAFLPYFRVLRAIFPKAKLFSGSMSKQGQVNVISQMEKTISSLLKENESIRKELRELHNQCVNERIQSRKRYNEMEDEIRDLKNQLGVQSILSK